MIPRVFLVICLSLLAGCGHSDHPTIRQTMTERDETPPATAAADLESAAASTTRPDVDPSPDPRLAETGNPRSPDATSSKATEPDPASDTDETTAKVDATPPGNPGGTPSKPASEGTSLPKTDGSAVPDHTSPVAPAFAGETAPPTIGEATAPKADDENKADAVENEVRFGGIRLLATPGWNRERPPMKFILAEFSVPRSKGDSYDAQVTVTLAVKNDPRSLEQLREQLKEEEESKESGIERFTISGREIILVDSSGDEGEDELDSPPSEASTGRYRSLNAMVFLDGSVYFVNCSGPEKTVTDREGEFRAFLETMEPAK